MRLLLLSLPLLLGACASTPKFETQNVEFALTPTAASSQIDTTRATRVLWGGLIINSKNLQDGTQLEILAYPLDSQQRPNKNADPLGRFLAHHGAYLETVDYAAGRDVTVLGTITGTKQGNIDEAIYVYPVIQAEQVHLWSKTPERDTEPKFNFGIGVMLH